MNGATMMESNNDDETEGTVSFTPEELLETVLNVAASAVEQQFDDDTRESLWMILDACAMAYGIESHREFDTTKPPVHFPFNITDVTPRKPK